MAFAQKLISVSFSYSNAAGGGTYSGLRVSLIAANAGAGSVGQLEMAVYGMSLSDMNALTLIGTEAGTYGTNTVTVTAGEVGGSMATVFTGTVQRAVPDFKAMPQVVFRVSAYGVKLQDIKPTQPVSMAGSADVAQLAQQIIQTIGVPLENSGVSVKLSNPYLPGTALTQMRRLAQHAGISWTADLDGSKIAIYPTGQGRQGGSILISPQTGLVGYPSYTSSGVAVTTYFNSSLAIGKTVEVQSSLTPACGTWKINKLEHELESMVPHGKWFSYIETTRATGQNISEGSP